MNLHRDDEKFKLIAIVVVMLVVAMGVIVIL